MIRLGKKYPLWKAKAEAKPKNQCPWKVFFFFFICEKENIHTFIKVNQLYQQQIFEIMVKHPSCTPKDLGHVKNV